MRKLVIMSAILLSSFIYKAADAQVKVSFNINVGSQPQWGPSGYDHVEYYYLPDLDMYYNVPNRTYTYLQGNRWITVNSIPQQYRNYDLYSGYKVVVNEPNPWNRNNNYRTQYAAYRGNRNQVNLRDYSRNVQKTKVVKYNGKANKPAISHNAPDKRIGQAQNVRSNNDYNGRRDQRGTVDRGTGKGRG
jgi:hypothetical protein